MDGAGASHLYHAIEHATPTQADAWAKRQQRLKRMVPVVPAASPVAARPAVMPAPKPEPPPVLETWVQRQKENWFSIENEVNQLTIKDIQSAVCRFYGVTMIELRSSRRNAQIVLPRQVGYYLSKKLTGKSLPDIGRRFNRDHTSALSGIRKIEKLRTIDENLESDLHAISNSLGVSLV
jgi:chromosomal replication initiation ATPase DnaA